MQNRLQSHKPRQRNTLLRLVIVNKQFFLISTGEFHVFIYSEDQAETYSVESINLINVLPKGYITKIIKVNFNTVPIS